MATNANAPRTSAHGRCHQGAQHVERKQQGATDHAIGIAAPDSCLVCPGCKAAELEPILGRPCLWLGLQADQLHAIADMFLALEREQARGKHQ
jgi:hypothetical protein